MSKVLTSFLVGIGFDTKGLESGVNKVRGSMDGVKTGALGISAALVGAFGAATASVAATAGRVDQLALATQNLRTSQSYVYDYGNALRLLGGDAGDALTTVQRMEEVLNNLRLRGDLGPLADLPLAGIDISGLSQAESGEDFIRQLAAQMPMLDEAQRALVQESLGLSDAVVRSLSGGVDELDKAIAKASGLTGSIDQLTEDSRRFSESTAVMALTVEGISNELATNMLPALVGVTENMTKLSAIVGDFITGKSPEGKAFSESGPLGVAAVQLEEQGLQGSGEALRMTGALLGVPGNESVPEETRTRFLETLIPGYSAAASLYESLFGGVSASDASAPAASSAAVEEERRANANALAGALSRQPVKVENTLNVQLDGQAIEAKIVDVTERMQYDTAEDLRSTTER